jgi:hypothetical protein
MDMNDSTTFTVHFNTHIPAGHWTQVTHIASGSSVCLGYLPGDVDGGRASNTQDILRIINCLNGVEACELYQGDVNRSAAMNPQDIIQLINLLNGVEPFTPVSWLNVSLPLSPCGGG